jgi:hypothetical protein
MQNGEPPQMHKYGERKRAQITLATVLHFASGAGRTKFQAAWFLLISVHNRTLVNFSINVI